MRRTLTSPRKVTDGFRLRLKRQHHKRGKRMTQTSWVAAQE